MSAKLNNASYAVLFVVGILTSIHCDGMCGGIMLTQSLSKNSIVDEKKSKFKTLLPSILYNAGRVTSYTIDNDLSKVSIDRLIKKANISGNTQMLNIKGTGYEFEPLVVVLKMGIKTNLPRITV